MRQPGFALAAVLVLGTLVAQAGAETAQSLAGRIVIDGFPTEYTPDEALFGESPLGGPEEPAFDSKWGPDNDLRQIHLTWDKDSLYVSGEGSIWNNNMILLFDVVADRGMDGMTNLNSWRRNFQFSTDFRPDLFLATWDGNASPQLILFQGGTQVTINQPGSNFKATATFSQSQRGRAMEFAIPWDTFFLGPLGIGATRTFVPSLGESVSVFPPGTAIKIAAVVTGGSDGTGGPDSAPDNTCGHVSDSNQGVQIDNYALVQLDELDDTGLGGGGPDGVADWGIQPKARTTFKFQPPLDPECLSVAEFVVDRPAFAPDRGELTHFSFRVDPPVDLSDPRTASRLISLTAGVYDASGRAVRSLYSQQTRSAATPVDPVFDVWDGRDDQGAIVHAGVYVLRLVVDPNRDRVTRPVVVVR